MKNLFLSLFLLVSCLAYSQKERTFTIEKLSKPEKLLPTEPVRDIYKRLIDKDIEFRNFEQDPYGIVAMSDTPGNLANLGYNSFFMGMYAAYADHRPFVLSPDMIWLLISQGFAQHVNANPEELRHLLVDFSDKKTLIVVDDRIDLNNPNSPWEEVFPEFTKQIAEYTGKELQNTMTADFSTTTIVERVASQITLMEAVKPYFDYSVMRIVCGIPQITLQGSTKDWEKVLEKAQSLARYDLEWWIKEIEPILKEIIQTSRGKIDKKFWQEMFKIHQPNQSKSCGGGAGYIDGWIVKFFPYDKKGYKNDLHRLSINPDLPDELVKVPLTYILVNSNGVKTETPLELWAGFIGLEQNEEDFALTPKIGWMIRKNESDERALDKKIKENKKRGELRIYNATEFPSSLLEFEEISVLEIKFKEEIIIPDEFSKVKIGWLYLSGKIGMDGIERIKQLFPDSRVTVNGHIYQEEIGLREVKIRGFS